MDWVITSHELFMEAYSFRHSRIRKNPGINNAQGPAAKIPSGTLPDVDFLFCPDEFKPALPFLPWPYNNPERVLDTFFPCRPENRHCGPGRDV